MNLTDMKDLEEQVRSIIEETYQCKYTGKIGVQEIVQDYPEQEHLGYKVDIYLNKQETPVGLSFMGDKKEFLDFLKKELKSNRYNFVDFFTAERIYFSVGCCEEQK